MLCSHIISRAHRVDLTHEYEMLINTYTRVENCNFSDNVYSLRNHWLKPVITQITLSLERFLVVS